MSKKSEKRVHILVVEDEESFVDALTIGLTREGIGHDEEVGRIAGSDNDFNATKRLISGLFTAPQQALRCSRALSRGRRGRGVGGRG